MLLSTQSDLWYQILPFLDVVEQSNICRVNTGLRNIAIHTFSENTHAASFMSFLFKFFNVLRSSIKQLSEFRLNWLDDEKQSVLQRASMFLPLIRYLALIHCQHTNAILSSFAYQINSVESIDMISLLRPFVTEMYYHKYKSQTMISIDTNFLHSLPSVNGFIQALNAKSSKIEHISFCLDCSAPLLVPNKLEKLRFLSSPSSLSVEDNRRHRINNVIQFGLPFYLNREGKNRIKEELSQYFQSLKSIQQSPTNNSGFSGKGNSKDTVTGSKRCSGRQGRINNSSFENRKRRKGRGDLYSENEENEEHEESSNQMFHFNQRNTYNLELNDIVEKVEKKDDNDYLVLRDSENKRIAAERYWCETMFNLIQKLNCNILESISINNCGVQKVSGKLTQLMKDMSRLPNSELIEYCAMPVMEDHPYYSMLLDEITEYPFNELVLEDSFIERKHDSILNSNLGRNLNHVIISYSFLSQYLETWVHLKNLGQLTIVPNRDEPLDVNFSRFQHLNTICIQDFIASRSFILREVALAPIQELRLIQGRQRSGSDDRKIPVGEFLNKLFIYIFGLFLKLWVSYRTPDIQGLGPGIAQLGERMGREPIETIKQSGPLREKEDLLIQWGREEQPPILVKHLILNHDVDLTSIVCFLRNAPELESLTCKILVVGDEYMSLGHLPYILKQYNHLRDLELHVAFPQLNDVYMFLCSMKRLNIRLRKIVLQRACTDFSLGVQTDVFAPRHQNNCSFDTNDLPSNRILFNEIHGFIFNQEWDRAIVHLDDNLLQFREQDFQFAFDNAAVKTSYQSL